jgi:tetratricopeptide (TPR) repeat protein
LISLGLAVSTLASASRTASQNQPQPLSAGDHLKRGDELRSKGDWDGAIKEYREAVRLNPKNDRAHQILGRTLGNTGDVDGTIAEEHEALRLNPKNDEAHRVLGWGLGNKGDWDGAIAEEREAIRLNPKNDLAHLALGYELDGKGDQDGAIAEYREAIRLNPKNDEAHYDLGVALGSKGDWDGQIAEERAAVRLNSGNDLAHYDLGYALDKKGDRDGAIAEYNEAIRLNPKNDGAHYNLGVALGSKGDRDGQIAEEREAVRLNPKNDLAHYDLGVVLEKKGDLQGALNEYRAAYALSPLNGAFRNSYERLRPTDWHFAPGPYVAPLLGLCAPLVLLGIGLFAYGFWNYRKLRVIGNAPRFAVRSIPMGLVHVHGKVTGRYSGLLTSPLTRTPCYYYHVQLELWKVWTRRNESMGWNVVHTEADERFFYLDDGTGKVLINPQSAEYDLPPTYWAVIGPQARGGPYLDPSLGLAAGPTQQELRAYAAKRSREGDEKSSYRITEQCLVAEHEYDLTGTYAENPQPTGDEDRNLILKGRDEPIFLISGLSEHPLGKALRKRAVTSIFLGGLLMVFVMALLIANLVKS